MNPVPCVATTSSDNSRRLAPSCSRRAGLFFGLAPVVPRGALGRAFRCVAPASGGRPVRLPTKARTWAKPPNPRATAPRRPPGGFRAPGDWTRRLAKPWRADRTPRPPTLPGHTPITGHEFDVTPDVAPDSGNHFRRAWTDGGRARHTEPLFEQPPALVRTKINLQCHDISTSVRYWNVLVAHQ